MPYWKNNLEMLMNPPNELLIGLHTTLLCSKVYVLSDYYYYYYCFDNLLKASLTECSEEQTGDYMKEHIKHTNSKETRFITYPIETTPANPGT